MSAIRTSAPPCDDHESWPAVSETKPILGGEIRERIWEEFNRPGVAEEVFRVQADKHRRLVEFRKPEVVEANMAPGEMYPPFPGTVLILSAARGRTILAELKEAYQSGDVARLKELGRDIKNEVEVRTVISARECADQLIDMPVYYDVRYAGKTLAPHLGLVNGISLGSIACPWNGGELQDDQFCIVDYRKEPSNGNYEVDHLVVKRRPVLNDLERQALACIPASESEMHISDIVACPGYCLAIIVIYAIVTVLGPSCFPNGKALGTIEGLAKEKIDSIGPHATARELLALRRQVFEDFRS
jgi:hypothetical protein